MINWFCVSMFLFEEDGEGDLLETNLMVVVITRCLTLREYAKALQNLIDTV